MNKITALLLFCIAFLIACNHREIKKEMTEDSTTDSALLIDGPIAVFISPDSLEADSLKTIFGEDDYYTLADDYVTYLGDTRRLLDSVGIPSFISEEDTLKFISSSGTVYSISAKDKEGIFPVYFFNGRDKPVKVEVMDDFKDPFQNVFMGG